MLSHGVEDVELPAGPAVVVREIVTLLPEGDVEERIGFHVFPPRCSEGIRITVSGPHLEQGERLAADADVMAQTLEVETKRA